jgi:hypothetical protein
MTRAAIGRAIRALGTEVLDSVASYFAPVLVVARDVSNTVHASEQGQRQAHEGRAKIRRKKTPRVRQSA